MALIEIIENNKIKNNDYKLKQIFNFNEVNEILNQKNNKKMKILYYNKNIIHRILYEEEKNIEINSEIINNEISNYFLLILLIEDNPNIINYVYSLNFIRNANNNIKLEKNNQIKSIIKYKIIIKLIKNYKEADNYNEEESQELEEIEDNNLKNINLKELEDLKLTIDDLNKMKIDEIYIEIINMLIKTNKIDNYEYTYNIIKELDLENIDLTETMFNKLSKMLNNEEYIKKYKIIEEKDIRTNKKVINFYYILFKYILKSKFYVNNINFLLEKENNFIKIIRNNSKESLISKLDDNNKEKMKYIYNFINNDDKVSKETQFSSKLEDSKDISGSGEIKNIEKSNENESYFKIINLENYFQMKQKEINQIKKNYSKFIKEMSNEFIISVSSKDKLYIINEKLELEKEIDFKKEINEDKNTRISGVNSNDFKVDMSKNKITNNIIEKKNHNNSIEIIDCSKNGLIKYTINLNNNQRTNINVLDAINLTCTSYFEIKNKENNKEYIVAGEKGLFHFNNSPFDYTYLDDYIKSEISYKNAIKINDNFIILTSNRIYSNGKDKLVIYDTRKKEIVKEIDGSFVGGVNGLMLIDIEENKKIIVCGCKKYFPGQNNGILTINLEIRNDNIEIISEKFDDTENFEVNCFCQINKEDNNNKNIYFFTGGFENERGEGIIQLYRLINVEDNYKIEYLQEIDIVNKDFEIFEGTINCIIQSKKNGKIYVNCLDGKIYCFSKPNIDYYLEEEEEDIATIFN